MLRMLRMLVILEDTFIYFGGIEFNLPYSNYIFYKFKDL